MSRRLAGRDWIRNADTLRLTYIWEKLPILKAVFSRMGEMLLTDSRGGGPAWNATFLVLLALLVLFPRRALRDGGRVMVAALAIGLLGYGFIYVLSPMGMRHVEKSLGRILLHFYPVAVVVVARAHRRMSAR